MARHYKLELSGDQAPPSPTFRPDRDRSRSPKRARYEPRRPPHSEKIKLSPQNGARRKGKIEPRIKDEFRERSPIPSSTTKISGSEKRPHKRPKAQNNEEHTKGLSDKIHSLRRLLEKAVDMPADIRQEKERELQGYLADQQRRQAMRKKNTVTSRYHFVRFMERKKAERLLKRMERGLDGNLKGAEGDVELEDATIQQTGNTERSSATLAPNQPLIAEQNDYRQSLHMAQVDLNYTLYAPLDQKYISLYPSSSREAKGQNSDGFAIGKGFKDAIDDDEAGIFRNDSGQKPPLWYEVEKAMANNTLEALRDGKSLKASQVQEAALQVRSMAKQWKGKKVPGIEPDSDDEDGGSEEDFFER